jgi:hypothetical protein
MRWLADTRGDARLEAVGELESPIPAGLRPTLVALEAYLFGEPVETLSGHVLALAST